MWNHRSKAVVVEFNGIKFRRYPQSRKASHRNYFWPGIGDRKRGVSALHVEIWKSAHGPVPEGHHIHHIDGDTLNNVVENLKCVTPKEHARVHFTSPKRLARARKHIAEIRPLAAAWHRSEEGRAWHSEHARRSILKREREQRACEQCGESYTTPACGHSRFCSGRCRAKARRSSGVDNVQRICALCRKPFTCNRYDSTACCSKSCGKKLSTVAPDHEVAEPHGSHTAIST